MEKIAFIDHSYHKKTKSSEFFITFLKEKYIVDVIWDESWCNNKPLDVSSIDENYYAVIFWQNIYPETVNKVRSKCANIIFIPMYDASILAPMEYWNDIMNVKVINFSKTLHNKTCDLGFQSFYIQYFPDYKFYVKVHGESERKSTNSVFFWNRREELNWNVVKELIGNQQIDKIHIHKALDPDCKFFPPSSEDEKKYNITYSSWFETRSDYISELNKHNIYIAPRLTEGIGFSFLEAMAMGKAVIAVDAPTMNEYIENGKNGYLFSLDDPIELNMGDILKVQKNARQTVQDGIKKWHEHKEKIYSFIASPIIIKVFVEKSVTSRIVQMENVNVKYLIKQFLKRILPISVIQFLKKTKKCLRSL